KMAEVNDGRVPLLVGGGGFSVRESLEFIEAVADCRIDGIHVIPYDKKVSGAVVERLYLGIADRSRHFGLTMQADVGSNTFTLYSLLRGAPGTAGPTRIRVMSRQFSE
ncbi:MAG: hypothetical protein ACKPBA_02585, partial [Planctomycetota bacterium]